MALVTSTDTQSPDKIVDVAVAVILRPDGSFLLARRPEGKPYAGYWEFPGGKVEPGEDAYAALVREIREELGLEVERAHPWITQVFTYPHATVKLHFFRVVNWRGNPHPHEGQTLAWQTGAHIDVAPLLPANGPVLRALSLPPVYGISNAAEWGVPEFFHRLEASLARGLRLVQVREKGLDEVSLGQFVQEVTTRAHRFGARVLVNGAESLAREAAADGVHLTSVDLMQCYVRPDYPLCAASCHNAEELQRAAELGLDFVVLSPVLPTPSHPGSPTLGWPGFAELVKDYPLPVYALGGVRQEDLDVAQQHGAHGIAMLRGAW